MVLADYLPNPVQVAKGLTDQTWNMPTNYWLVFFVFVFGSILIALIVWILRRADKQSEALHEAYKESTIAFRQRVLEVLADLEEKIDKIIEEIARLTGRLR